MPARRFGEESTSGVFEPLSRFGCTQGATRQQELSQKTWLEMETEK